MREIKNVIICGLGAIGSIYAEKLSKLYPDNLYILADEKRISKYEKCPVTFNSKPLILKYITPDCTALKADLIIFAVKNSGLEQAVKSAENFINDNTLIMSFLNGISSEDTIAEVYGYEKILYSYFVGHTSSRKGSEVTFDGEGEIVFGEKDNKVLTEKVLAVKNLFDKAGINYSIPEDMEYSMWKKFLVNVGTNQASAVLGGAYKLFQESENAMNFALSLMREAQSAAKANGVRNTDKMLKEAVAIIKSMLPETKSSMLQDVEAKRKTEVEIFAGRVIEEGRKHNISVPYNQVVLDLIHVIEGDSNQRRGE